MARLIDGTKATKEVMEYSRKLHEAGNVDAAGYVMWAASIVDEQTTIEADPVKHGKWISIIKEHPFFPSKNVVDGYTCSECGRYEAEKEPYCNCGAKMDKECE